MGKASILNKLNHKPQAHARVCEENKELEEKQSNCPLKYFAGKGLTLEGCRRTVTLPMALKFATRIVHNTKVLVIYNISISRVLAVVMEMSFKTLGWLVLKNR